ncbi:MAG: VWA domain-containing protein [Acidobacteria bacterium]|nr:VWA domain-containing protein [Acidobacteriota bacterium]
MLMRTLGHCAAGAILLSISACPVGVVKGAAHQVGGSQEPYRLGVSVDEVSLSVTAVDSKGRAVDDLELVDLRLRDNGKKPNRILDFEHRQDVPIRAGIVMDTSRSMLWTLARNRRLAAELVDELLDMGIDQSFLLRFDFETQLRQGWTDNKVALQHGLAHVADGSESRLGGTAVFDALYTACHQEFASQLQAGRFGVSETSNLMLLFTDGEDNASHARIRDVAEACQQAQVTIVAFSAAPRPSRSAGSMALEEMAQESGGVVFYDRGDDEALLELQGVVAGLRDKHVLVYEPSSLKMNGAFHRVTLDCPTRDANVRTQAGYYAPEH